MSSVPTIIKPGDEVVLMLNEGTYFNFGKLTGLSVETVTPPPIRERAPLNKDERIRSLRGYRFFEQELGSTTIVVKFTFEKSTAYAPTGDTDTPDSSSD